MFLKRIVTKSCHNHEFNSTKVSQYREFNSTKVNDVHGGNCVEIIRLLCIVHIFVFFFGIYSCILAFKPDPELDKIIADRISNEFRREKSFLFTPHASHKDSITGYPIISAEGWLNIKKILNYIINVLFYDSNFVSIYAINCVWV